MPSERVVEVSVTPVPVAYPKTLGRNAYSTYAARVWTEWLVRSRTEAGYEGVTNADRCLRFRDGSGKTLIALRRETVLGRRVDEFLEVSDRRGAAVRPEFQEVFRAHGWLSVLAFDLAGRALGVSAVELLGDRRRSRVEAYDSTLYFQDLLHPERGVAQVAEEAREGLRDGYRQFKLKVGRGGRWMLPQEGMHRDVEVVWAVREAVGPAARLMVDANCGYDGQVDLLAGFTRETAGARLFWLEELITASLDGYRTLRDLQARHCPHALLVAGEVDREPPSGVFPELVREGLIDGYQPDIVGTGPAGWQELEVWLAPTGVRSIPHNFLNGNLGRRVALVFGTASRRWVTPEDERCLPNVYRPDGFTFCAGSYAVPDVPGLGLEVDLEVFTRRYALNQATVST